MVPGVGEHGSRHAKAVLDKGPGISYIQNPSARYLNRSFLEFRFARLRWGVLHWSVWLIRHSVAVEQKSVPLELKLHTAWGPVEVKPQLFAVMPAGDSTLVIERVTLDMLETSSRAELDRIARGKRERSCGTYQWYTCRRIRVIFSA